MTNSTFYAILILRAPCISHCAHLSLLAKEAIMNKLFSVLGFLGDALWKGFVAFCEWLWPIIEKHPAGTGVMVSLIWIAGCVMGVFSNILIPILTLIGCIITIAGKWGDVGNFFYKLFFFGWGYGISMLTWSITLGSYALGGTAANGYAEDSHAVALALSLILLFFALPVIAKEKTK